LIVPFYRLAVSHSHFDGSEIQTDKFPRFSFCLIVSSTFAPEKQLTEMIFSKSTVFFRFWPKTKIAAKLLMVALMSKGFTVADPNDGGMLDVCGFAERTPDVISAFISGKF